MEEETTRGVNRWRMDVEGTWRSGVFRKQLESVECHWRTKFELTASALVSDIGEEKRKRRDMIQDQLNKSRQKQSELRAKLKDLEEIQEDWDELAFQEDRDDLLPPASPLFSFAQNGEAYYHQNAHAANRYFVQEGPCQLVRQ